MHDGDVQRQAAAQPRLPECLRDGARARAEARRLWDRRDDRRVHRQVPLGVHGVVVPVDAHGAVGVRRDVHSLRSASGGG